MKYIIKERDKTYLTAGSYEEGMWCSSSNKGEATVFYAKTKKEVTDRIRRINKFFREDCSTGTSALVVVKAVIVP